MRYGTPVSGPCGRPAAIALRALSYCVCTMALMRGLTASARAIAASSTSSALTSRLAIRPARVVASCLRYSSKRMDLHPQTNKQPGTPGASRFAAPPAWDRPHAAAFPLGSSAYHPVLLEVPLRFDDPYIVLLHLRGEIVR